MTLTSTPIQAGKMRAGMVVLEFMLADEGPGDGGLAIVRPPPVSAFRFAEPTAFRCVALRFSGVHFVLQVCGSHKSNYPTPRGVSTLSSPELTPYVTEVHARKGDAVLFCE